MRRQLVECSEGSKAWKVMVGKNIEGSCFFISSPIQCHQSVCIIYAVTHTAIKFSCLTVKLTLVLFSSQPEVSRDPTPSPSSSPGSDSGSLSGSLLGSDSGPDHLGLSILPGLFLLYATVKFQPLSPLVLCSP